jgi:hypothetical protein
MPSPPTGIWKNTPNKKDHYTQGYTSKVLFNYQATTDALEVADGNDIIEEIINNGLNFKGTNAVRTPYFQNADGRCFRISMYYLKPYDGNSVDLRQRLYDVDNDITYSFDFDSAGGINTDTGRALIKYECYLSVFYDTSNSVYAAQANGSAIYAAKPSSTAVMLQMSTYNTLTNGYSPTYKIRILNSNGGSIYPTSLMIEEIS